VLNSAEKLIDYACSPYLAFGVFHLTVIDRTARLLTKLGYRKSLIVQGVEGSEDLHVDRPTRTYLVQDGEARALVIDPEAYGLDMPMPEAEWTADEQLRVTEAVLRGEGHLACTNQVLLNGAVRLHLAERADSIEEGLYMCKSLLDAGEAWDVYANWKNRMQEDAMPIT
jgi:anthranilate phosphoribosyltransferase